jgi:putative transposase
LGGSRGRLIGVEEKRLALELVKQARLSGARKSKACEILGIDIKTLNRWDVESVIDRRKGANKKIPRKLSDKERQAVAEIACVQKYKDLTPYEIVADLAENGVYYASERSFYRILNEFDLLHHRSDSKPAEHKAEIEKLVATGSNQIWSWDITWLQTEVRGLFYFAYVVKDIWDKRIVGWEIHDHESDEIAAEMFKRLKIRHNMKSIILRSDNGNPMKGATMLATLNDLGVIPSYSRPRVSNDNPFIESLFKTLKYTAGYPGRFKSIEHARIWMADFVNWYNTKHRHSAIGYVTPQQRFSGEYKEIFKKRNETLAMAKKRNPERWGKRQRVWCCNANVYLHPGKGTKEKLIKKTA